jgi:pyocin large subunit-like protein
MLRRFKFIYFLFLFLCIASLSCSQKEITLEIPDFSASDTTRVQAGNFAPGQLEAHYQKHGYQFGSISQAQYLEGARELLNALKGRDVLEKTRTNGDVLHYRVRTGEFAVMAADGRIRTYFKTDYRYWMRQ